MKEQREDPAMPDRILAQMAQETPEMPADFHARWTRAVREEAAKQKQTERQREGRRQRRYILSAAAVFVFLIGGTLLTRNLDKDVRKNSPAESTGIVAEERITVEPAATMKMDVNDAVPVTTLAPTPEMSAVNGASSLDAEPAQEADLYMAAEEPAEEETEDAALPAAAEQLLAAGAAAKGAAENAEIKASEMKDAAAGGTAAEETAEESGGENEFVSFMKDLGMFTLRTLAAAAIAAALAAAAVLIHRRLKNRNNRKG